MDKIRVGLDFGTHQTKICVQRIPDEGHGEPQYEFFSFKNLEGRDNYFLPSIIQINNDDTLSYGFVDPARERFSSVKPILQVENSKHIDNNISDIAQELFNKYANSNNKPEDIEAIVCMLNLKMQKDEARRIKANEKAKEDFQIALEEYYRNGNVFRYFKQATFADRMWNKKIDCEILSIWYLSYVIFLLEEKYGTDFSINMGIPANYDSFKMQQFKAVYVLLSAYRLVEDVYQNNMDAFLKERVDSLLQKTEFVKYSIELKDEYNIKVFPEAYAGLISLTSRGKLSEGMGLVVDVGGGTTDISFFAIQKGHPAIYRYWSLPRGLNYIAEKSGFDYAEGDFATKVDKNIVDEFNTKKREIISLFIMELSRKISTETSIPTSNLINALKNRIVVYTGGGSSFRFLTNGISYFSDVKLIDFSIWNEENIKDKENLLGLSHILSTAYGLSIGESDEDVKLYDFATLFEKLPRKEIQRDDKYIDKDMC